MRVLYVRGQREACFPIRRAVSPFITVADAAAIRQGNFYAVTVNPALAFAFSFEKMRVQFYGTR